MPFPKESYYAGNRHRLTSTDKLFLVSALIGSFILLFSILYLYPPQKGYIAGAGFMLATALYFRLFFFIALEIILISEHGAVLLGIGPSLQLALPILLVIQLLFYYLLTDQLKNPFRLIGLAGISMLSIGFAYETPWVFICGSLAISTYAFYSAIKGRYPCIIWAVLNLIFAVITLLTVIF